MEYEIAADESVSSAVVRAVSTVDGRRPFSLPPLARVLDPDALDAIFDTQANGNTRTGGRVSFIYNNCRLTIYNDEYLTIQPLEIDS